MVTCEKPTGFNLVIPDWANAGKDAAANRIESVDRFSMGLSLIKERKGRDFSGLGALGSKS
jgi:hypothetical protein